MTRSALESDMAAVQYTSRNALDIFRTVSPGRWPIYVWLLLFVAVPNLLLIATSFMASSGGAVVYQPTLANYGSILESATVQLLAMKTIAVSLSSALLATAVAYPLAYYISKCLTRGKTVAALMIVIPLWISLLMRIFAWRIILGEHGVLNAVLLDLGLISKPSPLFLYTPLSVVLTLTSMAIPYVFVAAYAAIERVPASLTEAARDSGASAFRTFITVVWPITRQGTAIGVALAFLMAIGDYVTPAMVGGINGTMLGVVIASQFGMAGNWPLGAAMALYVLVLVIGILAILFRLTRSKGVLTEVDVGAPAHVETWSALSARRKVLRCAARVAFVFPYLILYAPLAIITMFSFNDSSVQALPFKGFTLHWYVDLMTNYPLLSALGLSVELALGATVAGVIVGTAFAFIFAHWQGRTSSIMENVVALPLAVPGVVLGISLVMAASAMGIPPGMGRLFVGHVVFVMPVILLVVSTRLRRVDPSFALASRDLGAGWWSTFWRIQLPMIRGAVVGGALLGFTMSVDEVVVSLFLSGPDPTLPVFVWNQTRFGFTPSVNAIFTCIGVISLVLIICAQMLINPAAARKSA
jgi:spermidine/putrescine transport system permease protein